MTGSGAGESGGSRTRPVLAVAAALSGAFGYLTISAAPAAACSCMAVDDAGAFEAADVVFVGDLVDHQVEQPDDPTTPPGIATWTFAVDEVFKGEALEEQEVVSAASGVSCGLELPQQQVRALVFARRDVGEMATGENQLVADLCGGTREGGAPAAFADLGEPPKPLQGSDEVAGPGAEEPTDDAADPSGGGVPVAAVAAGAAVAAAAIAGFVLLRRQSR